MAYTEFGSGFQVKARDIVDRRLILSKAEMLAKKYSDGTSFNKALPTATSTPAYLFTLCSDDLNFYVYHANNPDNAETGKFMKIDLGGSSTKAESGADADKDSKLADANPGDKYVTTDTPSKTYICELDSEGNKKWVEAAPKAGDIIYDETNKVLKYYDGTEWKEVGSGTSGGLSTATVSTTAPENPNINDLWLNPDTGVVKIYGPAGNPSWQASVSPDPGVAILGSDHLLYVSNGTKYVPINVGASNEKPTSGTPDEGKIYYSSTDGTYSVYENGVWYQLSKTWEGTQTEYDNLGTHYSDVVYYITD